MKLWQRVRFSVNGDYFLISSHHFCMFLENVENIISTQVSVDNFMVH